MYCKLLSSTRSLTVLDWSSLRFPSDWPTCFCHLILLWSIILSGIKSSIHNGQWALIISQSFTQITEYSFMFYVIFFFLWFLTFSNWSVLIQMTRRRQPAMTSMLKWMILSRVKWVDSCCPQPISKRLHLLTTRSDIIIHLWKRTSCFNQPHINKHWLCLHILFFRSMKPLSPSTS